MGQSGELMVQKQHLSSLPCQYSGYLPARNPRQVTYIVVNLGIKREKIR
jgi:hypothetical protein